MAAWFNILNGNPVKGPSVGAHPKDNILRRILHFLESPLLRGPATSMQDPDIDAGLGTSNLLVVPRPLTSLTRRSHG